LVDKNLGPVKSKLVSLLHFTRGQILNECNQPEKSIESFKLAISLYELAKDPDLEFANTYLSRLYSQFGNSLTGSGRYTESEFYHDKAIRLTKALGKPTPRQMGILYANLGSTLLWKGDLSKAEDVLKRALLEHDRILECNKYALANVYIRQKRLDEAFQLHSEVLELFSRDLGRSHHATADSCHKVGSILTMKEFSGRNLQDAE
jgi:tetratricopeptide (TPR) repeat protein